MTDLPAPFEVEVSVVVLAWRSSQTLRSCLKALTAQDHPSFEVVCWVNGSPEDEKIARTVPGIRVISRPRNGGFAPALVDALPLLRGHHVGLVNADAVLDPGWLSATTRHLGAARPSGQPVGAVGGRIYPWEGDGSPVATAEEEPHCGVAVDPITGWTRPLAGYYNEPTEMPSLSGAATVISRDAIDSVGWLDRGYFAYYEETDLFARMTKAGWAVLHEPSAVAYHRVAGSLGAESWRYAWLMHRNRLRFMVRCSDDGWLRPFLAREGLAALSGLFRRSGPSRARLARAAAFVWITIAGVSLRRSRPQGPGSWSLMALQRWGPAVDAVVVSHQQSEVVGRAINSLISQTCQPRSITIVDDGSDDATEEALQSVEALGVRVLRQENRGVVAARNAGAALSSSPWLVFLDADDWLDRRYIETVIRAAGAPPDQERVGIVTTGWRWEGDRKGIVRPKRPSLTGVTIGNRVHSASLIRRDAFVAAGGFSHALDHGYEDWDLALSVLSQGWRARRVRAPLLHYTAQPDGGRNRSAQSREKELRQVIALRHPDLYGSQRGPVHAMRVRLGIQAAKYGAGISRAFG